ncbi:uncharacterized protein LOC126266831 isoform X1 [Schistocerca gregaria]|uniref:uncharacterized protein LOC126266831 isoform X1 n=1 Tax=Schistocerca gregaria TaxID=7010 RepID=UPI00211F3C91|nr:uncharacterized protein LOC126266831 isoform X1 [Schistocerca gregaria]
MNSPPFTWPYSVPGMPGPPVATPPPPEAFPQPQPLPQMDGQLSSPPDVNLDSPQSIMADGSDLPLHGDAESCTGHARPLFISSRRLAFLCRAGGPRCVAGGRARVAAAAQEDGAFCACARAGAAASVAFRRVPAASAAVRLDRARHGVGRQRRGVWTGNARFNVAVHACAAGMLARWHALRAPSRLHATTATRPLATVYKNLWSASTGCLCC